jgi:pSer/pThr/pTyr-binding forkhead associated (FHA) protein
MSDPNRTQILSADPNRTQLGAPVLDPNKTVMGSPTTLNATQLIKPTQCPVCKTFNPAGVMFCNECGLIFDKALPADAFGAPAVQLPVLVDESGREFPLRPGENIVGREGDVMIVDGLASRRHAVINMTDGALDIEDLGSTNGTKANGKSCPQGQKTKISSGDKIDIGGIILTVSVPGASGATKIIASNKTAAISAPPQVETAPATLSGESGSYPLKVGVNTFGRKADNDVSIVDPYVSGAHGIIEIAEDGIFVTDTGSTNGTLLNDAKLSPNMRTKMSEEDVIVLGALQFRVTIAKSE